MTKLVFKMEKGMALVTVLIIALVLFILVGSFLLLSTNALHLNERYYKNLIALALAEAGVDFAVWEINFGGGDFTAGEGWSGANPKTTTITNFQDTIGNIYGDIDISVYNPGTDDVTIIAEGKVTSLTGLSATRTIRVTLERHKIFTYAILTAETIDVGGTANKIDSYNSSVGPYGGANVGNNGDIVTNGQADPAITLRGGATVDGDASTGPGGTVSLEGGAALSGTTDDSADEFLPAVVVPDSLATLASSGDISLAGWNSLELTSGDYKYDYLDLSAHATLTLNGDVNLYFTQSPSISTSAFSQIVVKNGKANLYFDGNVDLGGQGVLNESGDPADLTFYGTASVTNINLGGIGAFYGTFYAPNANYFYIAGNSEIYGAVVGDNVALAGNACVHFDENLLANSPTLGYDPSVWQEK